MWSAVVGVGDRGDLDASAYPGRRRAPAPPPRPRRRTARAPPSAAGRRSAAARAGSAAPRRAAPPAGRRSGDEVGGHAQPGQRGVAAHVADEEPLRVRRQAQVAGEQDVQAGGHVAGAGADASRPTSLGGARRRRPSAADDRVLAQRQRLGQVALHPRRRSASADDVLDQRVDHPVPGDHAGVGEDPLGQPAGRRRRSARRRSPPTARSCDTGGGWRRRPMPADVTRAGRRAHHRGAAPSASGSPPSAATPSQSAHTSEVAGCSEPQRASRNSRSSGCPRRDRRGAGRLQHGRGHVHRGGAGEQLGPPHPAVGLRVARRRVTRRAASSTTSRAAATAASARPIRARTAGSAASPRRRQWATAASTQDCATPTYTAA